MNCKSQQRKWCNSTSCILSLLFFLVSFKNKDLSSSSFVVNAQERPAFTTALYDPIFKYRQNVCDLHRDYYAGEVAFRDALQGFELRSLIGVSSLFPVQEDESIDPVYPGLVGVLLDELAERAGFTWRDSFAIYYSPGENKTYTDLLIWGADTYDIMIDWWNVSVERLQKGIGYPEGFYDASYILIGMQGEEKDGGVDYFNWLAPFDAGLWLAILGTTIASGLMYMGLECISEPDQYDWDPESTLFLSLLIFTQHFQYSPVSHAGRLFGASMAFWSLIVVATYTANLASFFVSQSVPPIQIKSIDDAVRASMPICIWTGAASGAYALATYPQGVFVDKDTEEGTLMGVKDGECDFALMSLKSWEQFESDRTLNGDCNLAWVGRVVQFVEAGFALKNDAGVLCTSMVHDVLNVHLVEMRAEGFIDSAWQDFFSKNQDLDCTATNTASDEGADETTLSFNQIAGTFLFHGFVTVCAMLLAAYAYLKRKYVAYKMGSDDSRGSGDHMKLPAEDKSDPTEMFGATSHHLSSSSSSLNDSSPFGMQDQLHVLRNSQETTNKNLEDLSAAQQEQKEQMKKMMSLLKAMYRNNSNHERRMSLGSQGSIHLSQSEHTMR